MLARPKFIWNFKSDLHGSLSQSEEYVLNINIFCGNATHFPLSHTENMNTQSKADNSSCLHSCTAHRFVWLPSPMAVRMYLLQSARVMKPLWTGLSQMDLFRAKN